MRVTATAILFALLGLTAFTTNANAYWTSDIGNTRPARAVNHAGWHSATPRAGTHERRFVGHIGGYTCEWAQAVGKFCGCYAAHSLGIPVDREGVYRGINLKRADEWVAFERVAPERANAVIWPGRHVARLLHAGGGMMTTDESWGIRTQRITNGLIFVNTNGGINYSAGTVRPHAQRHKRYAGA